MHLSAELIGRFKKNRKPFKSISLAGNPASLTCISNDFGYSNVFARQIEGLGDNGDVLVAISTSGQSRNILRAINQAKKKNYT
jgi:D-sedoheptulose 7-phosphate isomerase